MKSWLDEIVHEVMFSWDHLMSTEVLDDLTIDES